jgi:hypothetical protein
MNFASLNGNKAFTTGISNYNFQLNEKCNNNYNLDDFTALLMGEELTGSSSSSSQSYSDFLAQLQSNNHSLSVSEKIIICIFIF